MNSFLARLVLYTSLSLPILGCGYFAINSQPQQAQALTEDQVFEQLDDVTVQVLTIGGFGSGTLIKRTIEGKEYTFVLTCGHVVGKFPVVGIKHGDKIDLAKVILKSPVDEEDLAVCLLTEGDIVPTSLVKFLDGANPKLGCRVYHCGSSIGYENSFFFGRISKNNRWLPRKPENVGRPLTEDELKGFTQIQLGSNRGASGGGIYLEDGRYIGMMCRLSSENVCFMNPISSIRKYLEENDFGWLLDSSIPVTIDIGEL